jgi:hypothetical protein
LKSEQNQARKKGENLPPIIKEKKIILSKFKFEEKVIRIHKLKIKAIIGMTKNKL